MGWWSTTIMGGDTPLDFEGDLIISICDIDYDDFIDLPVTDFRSTLEANVDKMIAYANEQDDEIAFHVLGVLLVESGSAFTEQVRDVILRAIDIDKWAEEGDIDRVSVIANFRKLITEYDISGGTPVSVQYESLLERMANPLTAPFIADE